VYYSPGDHTELTTDDARTLCSGVCSLL